MVTKIGGAASFYICEINVSQYAPPCPDFPPRAPEITAGIMLESMSSQDFRQDASCALHRWGDIPDESFTSDLYQQPLPPGVSFDCRPRHLFGSPTT